MTDILKTTPYSYLVLLPIFLAVVPLLKFINSWIYSKHNLKIRTIELLYTSMSDSKNAAGPLVLEQIFYSTFKIKTSFDVIILLLKQPNPTQAIEDYKNGGQYLEVRSGKFSFKSAYQTTKKREVERYLKPFKNIGGYLFASFISSSLIVFTFDYFKNDELLKTEFLTFNIIWMILFLLAALIIAAKALSMITSTVNIKSAVLLINSQYTKEAKYYY